MLNYFGNTNLVPNGYVYTSHTGSKYVFLEGLWFNNSSMNLIDPSTYGNMYTSAQKQIVEHNSKNKLQIGKTYLREGHEHVYVGEGQYTQDGIIVEGPTAKIDDFQKADPSNTNIPNGFYVNQDMFYRDGKWRMNKSDFVQENPKYIKQFNDQAKEKILKYNETARVPINSTLNYRGETITWDGHNWVDAEGLAFDPQLTRQITKYLDSINYGEQQEPEQSQEQQPEQQPQAEPEQSQEQPQAEPEKAKNDGPTPENTTRLSGFDGEPVGKTDANQSEVPDGFVYNSPQGKKYFKKGGTWYSSETKKPINGGNIALINRAAATQIKQLDNSSPVKIGQEWTSKAGKTYKYVGDDRFISQDGKLLPKSMASKAKDSLTAQKDDHKEENSEIKDKVDADIDNTSTATPEDRKEEEKVDQEQAIDDHDAKQDDHAEGEDKIKSIANKIKAMDPSIARKITVLLTRADKLSLMAADILLSGQSDKVKQILQTLNNRDE